MTVPDYQTMMLPVLKLFAGGARNVAACLPGLKEQFALSDSEADELLPSGGETYLANRAHWARIYLSRAGLLSSPRRNHHVITEKGRQFLATNPDKHRPARIDRRQCHDSKGLALTNALLVFHHRPAAAKKTQGDGMKRFGFAMLFIGLAGTAMAGGLPVPVMDPVVVEAQTASSGGDNWVGVMMTLLVFGTALAN